MLEPRPEVHMPRPSNEKRHYDDLDPLPEQRLSWGLPWEPDREQEEQLMETDPTQMPDEDSEADEPEEDDGTDEIGGSGAALYPLSEHLGLG